MNQKHKFTKHTILVAFLLLAVAFISCEKYTWEPKPVDVTTPVSFQNDILPIFSKYSPSCAQCHGSGSPNFTPSKAYESVTALIDLQNPAQSALVTKLNSSPHDTRCSQDDRNKILAWITQGGQNN